MKNHNLKLIVSILFMSVQPATTRWSTLPFPLLNNSSPIQFLSKESKRKVDAEEEAQPLSEIGKRQTWCAPLHFCRPWPHWCQQDFMTEHICCRPTCQTGLKLEVIYEDLITLSIRACYVCIFRKYATKAVCQLSNYKNVKLIIWLKKKHVSPSLSGIYSYKYIFVALHRDAIKVSAIHSGAWKIRQQHSCTQSLSLWIHKTLDTGNCCRNLYVRLCQGNCGQMVWGSSG